VGGCARARVGLPVCAPQGGESIGWSDAPDSAVPGSRVGAGAHRLTPAACHTNTRA
jgi:hypothetical protein